MFCKMFGQACKCLVSLSHYICYPKLAPLLMYVISTVQNVLSSHLLFTNIKIKI